MALSFATGNKVCHWTRSRNGELKHADTMGDTVRMDEHVYDCSYWFIMTLNNWSIPILSTLILQGKLRKMNGGDCTAIKFPTSPTVRRKIAVEQFETQSFLIIFFSIRVLFADEFGSPAVISIFSSIVPSRACLLSLLNSSPYRIDSWVPNE